MSENKPNWHQVCPDINYEKWDEIVECFKEFPASFHNIPAMIKMRYRDGKTLQAIGDQFGVTRERIRQKIIKGFRVLRHPSRAHLLLSSWPIDDESERG